MVGTARAGATELTSQKVAHLLTLQVRQDLDLLLAYDIGLGMSRLQWLTIPAVEATASAVKTSIEKLTWLRQLTSAGAFDDPAVRIGFLRWQVLRAGTPLRLIAQNPETGPIPVTAAHAAEGLHLLLKSVGL